MFTLEDGRETLWQWDIDRYIIVNDSTICEVHFCNRTSDCSLVVEVKDGLAAIPNILLQDARPIRAYAYCDDKYTLTEQQFSVKARTKPEDYVYTETEILQYSALEARITALEDGESIDLSNYYTKEETDTAIYNSKDTYYLDFREATTEAQPATADMIEFVTRFDEGQNVCAHIRAPENQPNAIKGWQPATVCKVLSKYVFTANAINPEQIKGGNSTPYYSFEVKNDSTAGWVYYTKNAYRFTIATTDYVDDAIANIDIPEGDLSNYVTTDTVQDITGAKTFTSSVKVTESTNTAILSGRAVNFTDSSAPGVTLFNPINDYGLCISLNGSGYTTDGESECLFFYNDSQYDYPTLGKKDAPWYRAYITNLSDGTTTKSMTEVLSAPTMDEVTQAIQDALNGIATAEGGSY